MIDELRNEYPWPPEPPNVPEDWHGWLHPDTAAALVEQLGPQTRLVVECGSWLGVSARAILESAPAATLICIDHWLGSPEHRPGGGNPDWSRRLAHLFETFQRNLWPWRNRVICLRADTLVGLAEVADWGLVPDLVYLDSEHSLERVSRELEFSTKHWPGTPVVGDDYPRPEVTLAAHGHAAWTGRPVLDRGTAFLFPGWAEEESLCNESA